MKNNIVYIIILSLCLSMLGCRKVNSDAINNEKKDILYIISLSGVGPYWEPLLNSAKKEAEARNYQLIVRSGVPGDYARPQKLINMMQEAIDQGALGIALAELVPGMLDVKAREAVEAGTKVITYDIDIKTQDNRLAYVGTDNYEAGIEMGKRAAQDLIDKGVTQGRLTTVTYSSSAQNMVDRYNGLKEGFQEVMGDDMESFDWCDWIINELSVSKAKEQLQSQIMNYKDLNVVFTLGTESVIVGTMEAIKSQNLQGKIYHYAFDYSPTLVDAVDQELVTGVIVQNSEEIGRTLISCLADAVEEKEIKDKYPIDVIWVEAKDLKEYGETLEDFNKE